MGYDESLKSDTRNPISSKFKKLFLLCFYSFYRILDLTLVFLFSSLPLFLTLFFKCGNIGIFVKDGHTGMTNQKMYLVSMLYFLSCCKAANLFQLKTFTK